MSNDVNEVSRKESPSRAKGGPMVVFDPYLRKFYGFPSKSPKLYDYLISSACRKCCLELRRGPRPGVRGCLTDSPSGESRHLGTKREDVSPLFSTVTIRTECLHKTSCEQNSGQTPFFRSLLYRLSRRTFNTLFLYEKTV